MKKIHGQFNAIYTKRPKWYVGWVEEIPGVNSQGRTLKELKENLTEALALILQTNRFLAQSEAGSSVGKMSIPVFA